MKTPKFLSILTFMIVLGLVGCESNVDKGKLNIYDTIWYAVSSSEDFSYVEFCKNGTVNIQFSSSRQAYKWSARNGKFTVSYQNGSDVPNLQYSFEASYYAYGETTPKWITFEGEANITKKSDGTYTIFMAPSKFISGIGTIQFVSTLQLKKEEALDKFSVSETFWLSTSSSDDFQSVSFNRNGTMDIVFSASRQSYKWSARNGTYKMKYSDEKEIPSIKYSFEASYYAYGETTPKWITFEGEANITKKSDGTYTIFMAPSKYISGIGSIQFVSTLKLNMGNSTEDNGKLSIANTYWTSDGDDFKSVTFKKDGTMDIVFSNSRQSYKWSARRGKYSCTYPNDTELPTVKYSFEASYYAYGETAPKWITFESEATVRKSSDGSYTIFMAPSKYVSGVGNLQFISTLKMVR